MMEGPRQERLTTAGFGELLRRVREQARLSQSRLAQVAGFDHSYVSRLESGQRAPTREAVLRLAAAMGLSAALRDRLLTAAGFLPQRAEHLFGDRPVLTDVVHLLQSEEVPEPIRKEFEQMLELLVRQVRRSAGVSRESMTGEYVGMV
jgi:transcriptional regulator with XRE-family HTH domain